MGGTLADTIKEITREHLNNGGMLLGEALTAVGYVNGTVPENVSNIVELPMCDVAGAGFAVGASIVGRRPILAIRFQDFMFLNGSILVNYAAKAKEIFGKGCPIFIRAISAEGHGIGIVHAVCLHDIFCHVPGFKVVSPMTSDEYREIWNYFMEHDEPMYVSEHRISYDKSDELLDTLVRNPDITIYAIGASRFSVIEAINKLSEDGIKCNLIHIWRLKPLDYKLSQSILTDCKGLVVDSDYEISGMAQSIAYQLMIETGQKVYAMGRRDASMGVGQDLINGTPTAQRIIDKVKAICER